jgi:tRNA-uridine 2-sulfurtransferase
MAKRKVYVGMSGGVDSSVTASILVDEGYDVTGVYMKNWSKDLPGMKCPWEEDYQDAKRVAVQLGINFKMYDFRKEYHDKVVDYMIAEYSAGRTPNPDIMCNQEIKFKLFFETSLEDGAEMIATGHYAKVKNGRLYAADDKNKDQSYFLYRVSKKALKQTLFPLGSIDKSKTRQIAKNKGLVTADKKDSQGICFVGKVGIVDFLSQYVEKKPGEIKDLDGKVIGEHKGAIFYTLGQRHGLGVGGGLPFYVVGKDMDKNIVYVTKNLDDGTIWRSNFDISSMHWIGDVPSDSRGYKVRTRYRAPLVGARLAFGQKDTAKVLLENEVRALTPGQSAVFYDGEEVLGGGVVV